MNDKFYLGKNVSDFKAFSKQEPITGVFVAVDDEGNGYTAGDEGNVLTVLCHSGNQTMADNLLDLARGFQYQGFSASDAELPIEAELGDGLTVNGLYSMLANQVVNFGGGHLSEVSAPGDDEVAHAYPYVSPEERAMKRQIAQTRAQLIVGLDTITAMVEGKIDGAEAQTLINQSLESISLSVTNGQKSSSFVLKAGETTLSSGTITFTGNVVFESDLEAGNTTINGACITTGTIKADYIKLGGDLTVYRSTSSNTVGGYLGYTSSTLGDYAGIHIMSSDGENEVRATNYGVAMTSGADSESAEISCVSGSIESLASVYVYADYLRPQRDDYCSLGSSGKRWDAIWATTSSISTSDRDEKKDINYDMSEYSQLFDCLKPCNFRFVNGTSGRKHTGFVAQDIMEELEQAGVSTQDFACFIKDIEDEKTHYGLRYEELIALCVAEIQKLKTRVKLMEV